jgi:hypothetical protein
MKTRTEMQALLKSYKRHGLTDIRLNLSNVKLQAEIDRLKKFALIPQTEQWAIAAQVHKVAGNEEKAAAYDNAVKSALDAMTEDDSLSDFTDEELLSELER